MYAVSESGKGKIAVTAEEDVDDDDAASKSQLGLPVVTLGLFTASVGDVRRARMARHVPAFLSCVNTTLPELMSRLPRSLWGLMRRRGLVLCG